MVAGIVMLVLGLWAAAASVVLAARDGYRKVPAYQR